MMRPVLRNVGKSCADASNLIPRMKPNTTPRQAVLEQIWNSKGYDDLWNIMGSDAAARAGDIAPELLRQADDCRQLNPDLASRLGQMAKAVTEVHTCVDQFAAATNMADLLKVHTSYAFAYTGKFNRILGGFWSDALKSGDQARIEQSSQRAQTSAKRLCRCPRNGRPKRKGRESLD